MADDNCCTELITDDVIYLSNQLATVRQQLTTARASYGELISKPLQYSLDTGQTRQSVMNPQLSALERSIAFLQREEGRIKTELDALTGKGGHGFVFRPAW